MSYFPMFIELNGRRCLVVGGGGIALHKIRVLKEFGADVLVVSPTVLPEILELKGVSYRRKSFDRSDLAGQELVVAATDDAEQNRRISELCREKHIPVNAVDQIKDCSFIFPAYLKEGEVVAAFSSGGQSPATVQYLKEAMRQVLTPLLSETADRLGKIRPRVREEIGRQSDRKEVYRRILRRALESGEPPSEDEMARMIASYQKQDSSRVLSEQGNNRIKQSGDRMDVKSRELFEAAKRHIPGGVNSPVRAFQNAGRTPRFIVSGNGSRITDADGNEMIDYVCSWGAGIFGHAPKRVVEKVQAACGRGLTFGAPTEHEVVLAELIAESVPSMEVSRLVSSGTEAVMSAVRTARGYTGRDKIVKFQGCYHGHSDGLLVKAGSAALTTSVPDSAGVPWDYTRHTLIAQYNDKDSVEELFVSYPNEIAAVIVEPVAANMGVVLPEPGFLEFLREITKRSGALLIFDEVITGFRLARGGAQEYYGVTPDLTTLGKIVGGGMPIGAYGGRREIMEMVSPVGPVYQAGTLSGNPIAVTAGIETLTMLKEDPGIYQRLSDQTEKIKHAVTDAAGGQVCVNQIGSLLSVFFTSARVTDYKSAAASDTVRYADCFGYLLDHGIYTAPSQFEAMFVSDAHSQEDIACICRVFSEYFLEN
mgnify:CR=1 FL=1